MSDTPTNAELMRQYRELMRLRIAVKEAELRLLEDTTRRLRHDRR